MSFFLTAASERSMLSLHTLSWLHRIDTTIFGAAILINKVVCNIFILQSVIILVYGMYLEVPVNIFLICIVGNLTSWKSMEIASTKLTLNEGSHMGWKNVINKYDLANNSWLEDPREISFGLLYKFILWYHDDKATCHMHEKLSLLY